MIFDRIEVCAWWSKEQRYIIGRRFQNGGHQRKIISM